MLVVSRLVTISGVKVYVENVNKSSSLYFPLVQKVLCFENICNWMLHHLYLGDFFLID